MKYTLVAVLLLASLVFCLNCSDNQEKYTAENDAPLEVGDPSADEIEPEEEADVENEGTDEDFTLRDLGTDCTRHRYQMKPGVTESLIFTLKPDSGMDADTLEIYIKSNEIEKFGVEVEADGVEMISRTVEYPIWVIHADDLRADSLEHSASLGYHERISSFGISNSLSCLFS